MKKSIFLLFGLGVFFNAFSQSDYREGYIITNNNDTIDGFIDYRKTYHCRFKNQLPNREFITYTPGEIFGYGFVEDKFYISKVMPISEYFTSKVFLECLIRGSVSLYRNSTGYYIEKDDIGIYKLDEKDSKIITEEGKSMIIHKKRYIGILTYLLQDCNSINSQIQHLKLLEKSLVQLIEQYNKCVSSKYIHYQASKPWIKAEIGVYTGIISSDLKFKSNQYDLNVQPLNSSESFTLGTTVYISWPRSRDRVSMNVGAFYLNTKFRLYNSISKTNGVDYFDAKIETKELKIPLGIQYKIPIDRLSPFLNVGISSSFYLDKSAKYILETENNNVVQTYEYELFNYNNLNLGLWVGLGAEYDISKKLNGIFEIRYEITNGIVDSEVEGYSSGYSHLYFLFGIKFK